MESPFEFWVTVSMTAKLCTIILNHRSHFMRILMEFQLKRLHGMRLRLGKKQDHQNFDDPAESDYP